MSGGPPPGGGGAGDDPPAFRLLNEVAIVEQLARARLERALPDGLLAPHFAVLNHLVRLGDGRAPGAIARALQVTKGTMTNTLGRLEARGLVALEPDPRDGRGKRVLLTPAGRAARAAAVRALAPTLAGVEAALGGPAGAAALLPPLGRLRAHLDRARDADPGPDD